MTYGGDTCDSKANDALGGDHSDMDISFVAAGSLPGGQPLDNVSGTIYAAGPRADFENALFGSANLAVLASCIFIDSGDVPSASSTFASSPTTTISPASASRSQSKALRRVRATAARRGSRLAARPPLQGARERISHRAPAPFATA